MMLKSAGCIILHKFDDKWHMLLVHAAGNWKIKKMGIPKGLVEKNEAFDTAAKRETFEETGLDVEILDEEPIISKTTNKTVYGFLSMLKHKSLKKIDENLKVKSIDMNEVDYARFYPLEKAKELIYNYQIPFVTAAQTFVDIWKLQSLQAAKNFLSKP